MNPEQIVRALAYVPAPTESNYPGLCTLCHTAWTADVDGVRTANHPPPNPTLAGHEPGCLWRLAREWTAANPVPPAPPAVRGQHRDTN